MICVGFARSRSEDQSPQSLWSALPAPHVGAGSSSEVQFRGTAALICGALSAPLGRALPRLEVVSRLARVLLDVKEEVDQFTGCVYEQEV